MGLWLERRDKNGGLIHRARFFKGLVDAGEYGGMEPLTYRQARELCAPSAHLPISQREWALRIGFDE